MKKNSIVISVISVLLVVASGVAIYFGVYNTSLKSQLSTSTNESKNRLENIYQFSLNELMDCSKNLSVALGKLEVATSMPMQLSLITKIESLCNQAISDLEILPIKPNQKENSIKYLNQLSAYSTSLATKLTSKIEITEADFSNISSMYQVSKKLDLSMTALGEKMVNINFYDLHVMNDSENFMSNDFNDMNDSAFKYPSLIYDGPFSDSKKLEIKVNDNAISREKAEENIKTYFADYDIAEIEYINEIDNKISSYDFNMTVKNGDKFYIQIAKNGGKVALMENFKESSDEIKRTFNAEECKLEAERLASKLGFDVKAMWVSKPLDGCYYINMTCVEDDIVIYPDMVKMVVCTESGKVKAIESYNYLSNHSDRKITLPQVSIEQAKAKLKSSLKVLETKLVIVPKGNTEVLCYEFLSCKDDCKYFVYIDANKNTEVDILKMVEQKEGFVVL